jgi:hypothetical protein
MLTCCHRRHECCCVAKAYHFQQVWCSLISGQLSACQQDGQPRSLIDSTCLPMAEMGGCLFLFQGATRAVDPISESAPSTAEQEPQHSAHAGNDLEQKPEPNNVHPLSNGDAAAHGVQSSDSSQREGYRDRAVVQESPCEDPADTSKAGAAVFCHASVYLLLARQHLTGALPGPTNTDPLCACGNAHLMPDMLC